ncbi:tetratricopeptide repeat protein [Cryptosporangium sp. NPDC051539]|uniref:tetratricopeptide repeat protein n=1 Tax=Cryptosporangium sp. NPDC051539 TaxID=3363962 RepID=UPI0037A05973
MSTEQHGTHTIESELDEAMALGRGPSRDWTAAIARIRGLYERCLAGLGPDHSDTLRCQVSLVDRLGWEGADKAQTAAELEDIAAHAVAALGPDHPVTVFAIHKSAVHVDRAGQRARAIELLRSLIGRLHVYEEGDKQPIVTRGTLGTILLEGGQFAESATILTDVVRLSTQHLGPSDSTTLFYRSTHADAVGNSGDPARAVALYRELLADVTDESARLRHLEQLAHWAGESDDPQTLILHRELVTQFLRRHGPDDEGTIHAQRNLGAILLRTDELEEATVLARDCVARSTNLLGPDDLLTLRSRWLLACLLERAEDYRAAAEEFERLFEAMVRSGNETHFGVRTVQRNRARCAGLAGHPRLAAKYYAELVEAGRKEVGSRDVDVLNDRIALANYVSQSADHPTAAQLYSDLIDDVAWVCGPDDRITLQVRQWHAIAIGNTGDPRRAANLLIGVRADQARALGADDPDTGDTNARLVYWSQVLPPNAFQQPWR